MLVKKLNASLLFILFFSCLIPQKIFSQCFQIESILVAACTQTSGTEGYNEMFRFRVGPTALNTSNMTVNWPSNSWTGIIQNATTTSKVVTLNKDIVATGGCALLLQPIGGVLPPNALVIVVSSYLFDTTANSFNGLTEDTYIIFQNNLLSTGGHFGNYATTGTRSLSVSFGGGCTDNVTYTRNLLSQSFGATVNFTPSGTASYTNYGCSAPIDPFSVDASVPEIEACPGETINLNGTSEGQSSVKWSATSGVFSNENNLSTSYTVSSSAIATIPLTLTATNSCGKEITDIINIKIKNGMPTFNAVAPICSGQTLSDLPTTSINGITGTWSPALDNTTTKTYTFTPTAGQCASSATLLITVNSSATIPTFNAVAPLCSGQTLSDLPTTSINGITGTWSPTLDNTTTKTYTFTPTAGQCATTSALTITVNTAGIVPTFNAVPAICPGGNLAAFPNTSINGITGTWSPALINTTSKTYTFTPNSGQCATTTTLTTTVNESTAPAFNAVAPICSGQTLSDLPTTSINGITGTWSPALDNTSTKTYTFTPNSGQCASSATLLIIVNSSATIPTFNAVAPICSGQSLSDLPTTSTNGITGTWSPALDNTTTKTYTFTPNSGQCALSTTLIITVNAFTNPTLDDKYYLCANILNSTVILNCKLSNTEYSFVWTLDGVNLPTTTNTHIATQIGKYEVTATNKITLCFALTSTNVLSSSIAIAIATVGEDFNNTQIITVNVTGGSGDYEFQLENGLPQKSNQFYISKTGEYEVVIRDKNGCGELSLYVKIINYPHFFTPNGDGYNDYWTISSLENQPDAKIFIFDRYGKLITSLKPSSKIGWNGKYNGSDLPSSDYWFVLSYLNKLGENTAFKAHFSLKR